jgi:hypothetical protein
MAFCTITRLPTRVAPQAQPANPCPVAADRSGAAMRAMDWRDFERLVGEAFRMRGFAVRQ